MSAITRRRELQAQRESLIAALASGLKTVRDANGELVTYQDTSQMRGVLDVIDAELRRLSPTPSQTVVIKTSKGL